MYYIIINPHFTDEKNKPEKNMYLAQGQVEELAFKPRSPAPHHLWYMEWQVLLYLKDKKLDLWNPAWMFRLTTLIQVSDRKMKK